MSLGYAHVLLVMLPRLALIYLVEHNLLYSYLILYLLSTCVGLVGISMLIHSYSLTHAYMNEVIENLTKPSSYTYSRSYCRQSPKRGD